MEEMLRSWLYALLLSGCICSLLLFFHSDGRLKPLLETGCACVMMLTFLSPITKLSVSDTVESYFEQWTTIESQATDGFAAEEYTKSIIEREYGAYILTKAGEMNIDIQEAAVCAEKDENECWLPVSVVYTSYETIPAEFKAQIAKELGISEERQITNEITRNGQ